MVWAGGEPSFLLSGRFPWHHAGYGQESEVIRCFCRYALLDALRTTGQGLRVSSSPGRTAELVELLNNRKLPRDNLDLLAFPIQKPGIAGIRARTRDCATGHKVVPVGASLDLRARHTDKEKCLLPLQSRLRLTRRRHCELWWGQGAPAGSVAGSRTRGGTKSLAPDDGERTERERESALERHRPPPMRERSARLFLWNLVAENATNPRRDAARRAGGGARCPAATGCHAAWPVRTGTQWWVGTHTRVRARARSLAAQWLRCVHTCSASGRVRCGVRKRRGGERMARACCEAASSCSADPQLAQRG